jgi:hypothetical protein
LQWLWTATEDFWYGSARSRIDRVGPHFAAWGCMEESLVPPRRALCSCRECSGKFNALAADVNVPRSFDQRANIAVAFATE